MKKVRGKKRKLRMIEQRLIEATIGFPQTFYNEVHVVKLPASQTFIEALRPRESARIARFLLECANALFQQKLNFAYKIVVLLFPNDMWYSQVVLFEHRCVQDDFFTGKLATGDWREEQVTEKVSSSHWSVRQFTDVEQQQTILCYIER